MRRAEEKKALGSSLLGGGAGTLGCACVVWFSSVLSVLTRQSGDSFSRAFGGGGGEGSKHPCVSPLLKDLH